MSDDRCPEHNCDIAVCFEEHKMKDEAFEKAWRTSPWFGNAHERTVAWSFWQATSLNQAVQAEAHLREPQTAETCQAVPPHPIGCLVLKEPDGPVGSIHVFAEDEESICLACEAEKQARNVARLAFETLAEERDHLKAERERHIEAAAHKELDWFAEKRQADLLEAKCAELWQLLETVKYRIDLPAPNISGSNGLRKLLETLPNNPGQLLLDRLKGTEECRDHYMNLLAEEVNLSNSLQEQLEKLELIYHEAHFVKEPHLSLLMALKAGPKCTICSNEALAACEPKERG